jgi:hypothetical protein
VEESYPDYIVGAAKKRLIVKFTFDPERLDNHFGTNPDAPDCLSPVYFKRDLLARYYSNPAKYVVADGATRCGALWLLRIDNHLPAVVSVSYRTRERPAEE